MSGQYTATVIGERKIYLTVGQRNEARGWLHDIGVSTKGDSIKRVLQAVDSLYYGNLEQFAQDTAGL